MSDFLPRLADLVENGAVTGVLERAYRSCHWHIDPADFKQKVLLRAIEQLDSFRGETTPEFVGWLEAIARQVAAQVRRGAHTTLGMELLRDVADRVRPSDDENAADDAQRAADSRWLGESLATLDAADRMLLERHYWGCESFVAIARDMGLTPNTLSHRHRRILRLFGARRKWGERTE